MNQAVVFLVRGTIQKKMNRFTWIKGIAGWSLAAVGTGLAIITYAQQYMGLDFESSLLILIVLALGGSFISLFSIARDIEDDIEDLHMDVNGGFDRVLTILDDADEDVVADGGTRTGIRRSASPGRVEPTGGGAFGGMIAGSAVGSIFGPPGLMLGALVGGLLGNEIEYQNLKRNEREKLRTAAEDVLSRRAGLSAHDVELLAVRGPGEANEEGWKFEFEDEGGTRHLVTLSSGLSGVEYEKVEEPERFQ